MKPLHHKTHTPAKRFLSLLCILALCLSLLPVTALAADGIELYVGGQLITESGCYANQDGTWTKVDGTEPDNGQFYYDADTITLTLNGAEISHNEYVTVGSGASYYGSVIAFSQTADVSLKIVVSQGRSTITGTGGIRVDSTTGNASLSIKGSGSLDVEPNGSNSGITLCSSKNTNLDIDGADVTASSPAQYGVYLISSTAATTSTITVNKGSLTTGGNGYVGIYYYWSGTNNAGTSSLTVSGNAVVDTRNSQIMAQNKETVVQVGAGSDGNGGIVFDGKSGTVYGDVELQDDLEIKSGESLTVGKDASLTVPDGKTLTNNGTVTTEEGGTLTGNITNAPPKINTESLDEGTVNTAYNQTLAADNNPAKWSVTSGSLPGGLTLNESTGEISGIPTTAEESTFTVTATNSAGSDSKAFTLTVTQPVTSVTLNKNTLELYTGGSENLTATVAPDNATNKTVTWSSSDETVATVDNKGNVTAVKAGTATITVKTADGGKTATCTVTVTDKTYTISADTTALDFGSAYTGYAQPASKTVTVKNTGNQPVTLNQPSSTDNFEVGTLSKTALAAGDPATFTVQPKAGLAAGTYRDTITVSDTNNNVASSITASFTVKSRPSYNPPTVSEKTTDAIQAADPGETVTVDLSSGSTKLDKEVFEALAGRDVTLVVDLGDGVSWTVNGSDIPEDADFVDIDMGVTMNSDGIPVDIINAITGEHGSVQIELAHDGAFGFAMTLTAPLGVENAGYWANLYHYDEDADQLTFETAAEIDADGSVTIPFSHASQYAIVIDTHSHATVDVSDLFIDIAPDAWYKDAIQYAYDNGLMTGVSDTEFAPEATTTRAMIVSILARLEGVESAQAAGFADVNDNDWYATAVNWAANVGVVNGYEDNTFQPNTAITREQLAAILMNYAAYKGEDVSTRASLATYTDQPSTWAKEAMSWAVAEGLISGVTADTLQPQGAATRAQVAAILQRFLSE